MEFHEVVSLPSQVQVGLPGRLSLSAEPIQAPSLMKSSLQPGHQVLSLLELVALASLWA